jgi:hypothetical protein
MEPPVTVTGRPADPRLKRLKAIHYYTVAWDDAKDRAPEPVMVAVHDLPTKAEKLFSIQLVAGRNNVPPDQIPDQRASLERAMLEELFAFMRAHPKARWVHWGMRNEQFGFAALEHRFRELGGEVGDLPDLPLDRRIDLAEALKSEFGKRYAPDPRFPNLVRMLGLTERDLLSLEQLTDAVRAGQYGLMQRSLFRFVGPIAEIGALFLTGQLRPRLTRPVTASNPRRKKNGWVRPATSPAGKEGAQATELDRECAAIAIMFKYPDYGLSQIADKVGVGTKALYKMERFRKAAVMVGKIKPRDGPEGRVRRGFRDREGRIEAFDEPDEG